MTDQLPLMVMADAKGRIFEHPSLTMMGRSGAAVIRPDREDLIKLPQGSTLFSIPGRIPIGWNQQLHQPEVIRQKGVQAVSAFIAPGYTRTLLPATERLRNAPRLPLFAYCAVGWKDDAFWVPAIRVDQDTRCDPWHYQDDNALAVKVRARLAAEPQNRLLKQLSRCALEYHCFAAKNVFNRRWEFPIPTARTCNARCLGCISLQPSQECPSSMERIKFRPTPQEVCELVAPHLAVAERPIASFGQGCEGEPLTEYKLLADSITLIRRQTQSGTINLNSNGYSAERLKVVIDAGLESIRFSLNSLNRDYYHAYYRPVSYTFEDVMAALRVGAKNGLFVSLNLLVQPGFTDRPEELELLKQLHATAPFHLIQMRNLNIDPDFYTKSLGYQGQGMGIRNFMNELQAAIPGLHFGYYNPIKEDYQTWEIVSGNLNS